MVFKQQAAKIGLQINKRKTEIMRNQNNETPVLLDNDDKKEMDQLNYLWRSILASSDIKNTITWNQPSCV